MASIVKNFLDSPCTVFAGRIDPGATPSHSMTGYYVHMCLGKKASFGSFSTLPTLRSPAGSTRGRPIASNDNDIIVSTLLDSPNLAYASGIDPEATLSHSMTGYYVHMCLGKKASFGPSSTLPTMRLPAGSTPRPPHCAQGRQYVDISLEKKASLGPSSTLPTMRLPTGSTLRPPHRTQGRQYADISLEKKASLRPSSTLPTMRLPAGSTPRPPHRVQGLQYVDISLETKASLGPFSTPPDLAFTTPRPPHRIQ
ncbi:hypothetical protein DFH07DRAFT_782745 [Mycena maculata]|uniref:Uncharacterized protein n=1 Tax=Mycena maculata TaxID=230809 RepID=A0AAD7HR63_9AGAR|nr:hypothetical protein DFH07DRAFT_782745 [Mycena maculata]